jgi:fucose permease
MGKMGLASGWVLIYTALIMMILRFLAGPIIHKISPLGLLAVGSALAVLGLVFLSKAAGILIFIAATIYAFGKSFFWPTMLGVAAERFPKGGALTINAIGGMGMLSVGVLGAVFLGNIQDRQIDRELLAGNPALHDQVAGAEKSSVFGRYQPLDQAKLAALAPEEKTTVETVAAAAKKNALMTVAIFPAIMFVCFLILIFYFKAKGGYKPVELEARRE